jgi:predicted transcriptional regulator
MLGFEQCLYDHTIHMEMTMMNLSRKHHVQDIFTPTWYRPAIEGSFHHLHDNVTPTWCCCLSVIESCSGHLCPTSRSGAHNMASAS